LYHHIDILAPFLLCVYVFRSRFLIVKASHDRDCDHMKKNKIKNKAKSNYYFTEERKEKVFFL